MKWKYLAKIVYNLQESEARTDLLRERSRKRKQTETETDSVGNTSTGFALSDASSDSVIADNKHINFFQDLEDGVCYILASGIVCSTHTVHPYKSYTWVLLNATFLEI